MSVTRYLDINSQNRDRTQYANQAQFQVSFDGVGARNAANAFDSVCNSAPVLRIHTAFNKKAAYSNTLTGNIARTVGSVSAACGGTVIFCKFVDSSNLADRTEDFYAGAVVKFTGATLAQRRIMASTFMTNTGGVAPVTTLRLRLETPLPDAIIDEATVEINSPSDNISPAAHIFIPTGVNIDNFYVGYQLGLIDVSAGAPFTESVLSIVSYDGVTRIATMSDFYQGGFNIAGSELVLRRENRSSRGVVSIVDSTLGPYPVDMPINVGFLNTSSQITLAGIVESAIVGSFIRIMCVAFPATPPTLNSVVIRKILTSIVRAVVPYGGGPAVLKTFITFDEMSFVPIGGTDTYEILPFSYDNSVPISFSSNLLSLSEVACYEIKLINILLPNTRTLLNGRGGKFSSYPYIWVELSGVSAGSKNAIWSNARDSTTMLFKVPMKDVNHPDSAQFIKLDGAGMSQFIPFKPVDTFNFSVRLPDGTVPLIGVDTESPVAPNELIQISATFELRRRT